jgi:hypothetical protein
MYKNITGDVRPLSHEIPRTIRAFLAALQEHGRAAEVEDHFATTYAWFAGLPRRFHTAGPSCNLVRARTGRSQEGPSPDCRQDGGKIPSQTALMVEI